MVIHWTRLAQESLRQVFDFYVPVTGKDKALEIVQGIMHDAKQLEYAPYSGSVFYIHNKRYHKLVTKRYTIFYEIDDTRVFINLVWDNRRNPALLRRLL